MLLFCDKIDNEFVEKPLYQVLKAVKSERFSPAATFAAPEKQNADQVVIL